MSNTTTFVERGKAYWSKILGDPVKDYDGTNREWTLDFVPIEPKELKTRLKKVGEDARVRVKEGHLDDQPYMTLKQKEKRSNGALNRAPEVVDAAGNPWPTDKLIGNESIVDVKFDVIDFGPKKYNGVYLRGVRVLEHVPYKPQTFSELDENDKYYEAAQAAMKDAWSNTDETNGNGSPDVDEEELNDEIPM